MQSALHRALLAILREIFDGPPSDVAFVLNVGDPGLLRQLESIGASTASFRPMPGRMTIAAHVDHVLYGLELLNRWSAGEADPWATADWTASWQRGAVDDAAWGDLLARLRRASDAWQRHLAERT